jgi:two-component system, NtrC family, sensor histidine kinase KinB
MKSSIRTKFSLGMIFLFMIILVLSVFSGFYVNKLSKKTGAILKENYLSVVYARDMSEGTDIISQEITRSYLMRKSSDSSLIQIQLSIINKALQAEKNNITEPGEGELVTKIEYRFKEYCDSVMKFMKPKSSENILWLQNISGDLHQQLVFLSQMNGNAIQAKTEDAKTSAKNAWAQMTFLGTICFLIALTFTYNFASFFNKRFFQLYNGIKELVASNYDQRLHFEGKDEFYEISLVINEMAEKLSKCDQKTAAILRVNDEEEISSRDVKQLKEMLSRIKSIEEQAAALISRFEKS